jgi:hypothetical protein
MQQTDEQRRRRATVRIDARAIELGAPAPPLRALLAQRCACGEPSATCTAQAEDADTARGDLAMDRGCREGDQGIEIPLRAERAPNRAPRKDSGEELTEELHRSLGSSRAKRTPHRRCAARLRAGSGIRAPKMHDTCPGCAGLGVGR